MEESQAKTADNKHQGQDTSEPHTNDQQVSNTTNETNINNYIQNLDVANVLAANLSTLDGHQTYIDPSLAAAACKRAALEGQRERGQTLLKDDDDGEDSEGHYNIPGIPPLPPGIDPKKTCPFCHRTFSHPGSMGRHLDLKKGTEMHPVDLIEKLRAHVKRRGDIEKVKQRRRLRARIYNAREDVRERSKAKRRVREKINRAKKQALQKFTVKLGRPQLQPHPTFARLVLYFLSPDQWPHDPPTLETYRLLCGFLNSKFLDGKQDEDVRFYDEIMQKVHTASENWLTLSDAAKQDTWIRELRRAAEDSLSNISLYDLTNRDQWIMEEARHTIESNANKDESDDSNSDNDDERNSSQKNSAHSNNENSLNTDSYYNQEELAAVAEAVVNNSNQHHNQNNGQRNSNDNRRSPGEPLDPQLMD